MAVPMRGTSYPTAKPAKKKNRIKETAMTNQYAKVEPIINDDDQLEDVHLDVLASNSTCPTSTVPTCPSTSST